MRTNCRTHSYNDMIKLNMSLLFQPLPLQYSQVFLLSCYLHPRSVCDRVLALAVSPAGVHSREDGDGHDDPAHPGRHVRGREAEHAQGQLRLCAGCVDVQLCRVCVLHPP